MQLEQAAQDIVQWIQQFLEVPHPALNGWPPCPYARSARIKGTVDIRPGTVPSADLESIAQTGLGSWELVIYVYDPQEISHQLLSQSIQEKNVTHLVPQRLLALEDHPHDVEYVNGVCMNQGTWAMAMVQSLDELNQRAAALARQGYYHNWDPEYLQGLFQHRQDPRS